MTSDYAQPISCGLSKSDVAVLAERVGKEIKYCPTDDIATVVGKFGGDIAYQDFWELEDSDSGSIRVESDCSFRITLANHTSSERDRFTVAHELGHFFLHFLMPRAEGKLEISRGLQAQRFGTGQTEYEANWFAASFLMPQADFKNSYVEHGGNLNLLAPRFSVSLSAAAIRAKALGLE